MRILPYMKDYLNLIEPDSDTGRDVFTTYEESDIDYNWKAYIEDSIDAASGPSVDWHSILKSDRDIGDMQDLLQAFSYYVRSKQYADEKGIESTEGVEIIERDWSLIDSKMQ